MSTDLYSLKQKEDTEELHLFVSKRTLTNKCDSASLSICEKMSKSENAGNLFECYSETQARTSCASIGRSVCRRCISHLYQTY
ncbi:MAG: hypothetical protein DWQ44_09720 [Bacteroidetes bacterium]|nr:MAG: hypothetical protein DWQ33_09995 [Bacteroidota bacterium]REK06561.1 MAG: hypothetical protein DWQ39_03510 [Bacteroidota bacterium]REK33327.1 MAG: hypothetical protein DWQ44_09720 [Bacteroidota bacterium]REK49727.1 MAG: hypothetical protein DWQ48_06275 [Bacteroidota bacterium]